MTDVENRHFISDCRDQAGLAHVVCYPAELSAESDIAMTRRCFRMLLSTTAHRNSDGSGIVIAVPHSDADLSPNLCGRIDRKNFYLFIVSRDSFGK